MDRFPDGQLYVDLRGATAGLAPLGTLEVLGRLLPGLGVESSQVPAEVEDAAARFRTEAASRRLLVVLDNARGAGEDPRQPRRRARAPGTLRPGADLPARGPGPARKLSDRHSGAENLQQLGMTLRALGRHHGALAHWEQALAIFDEMGNPAADEVRALIAERSVTD